MPTYSTNNTNTYTTYNIYIIIIDYLPDLQILHSENQTYLRYIKRKTLKGQLTPVGNFNSEIKLKKIYMVYKRLVSFPSLSFSFSGD